MTGLVVAAFKHLMLSPSPGRTINPSHSLAPRHPLPSLSLHLGDLTAPPHPPPAAPPIPHHIDDPSSRKSLFKWGNKAQSPGI